MASLDVDEYEALIATGLGCLDTALKRVKLGPRMEARIRLRYAGVLLEETENSMEAETTLSKGIFSLRKSTNLSSLALQG